MSYQKMMAFLPKKDSSLQEVMKQAQIPGVSIAYINSEGIIVPQVEGLTDGCGLFRMSNDPTKCKFYQLGLGTKNTVVLFNDELYYVDQREEKVQKIEVTASNRTDVEKLQARCTDTYKLADSDDHHLIQSLTGRSPPTEVTSESMFGVASLSKPLFAYLVQKLIAANAVHKAEPGSGEFKLPKTVPDFNLDTPLSSILPLKEFRIDGVPVFDTADESAVISANTLTPRMVLSHMTGLDHGKIKFQFKPEEKGHGYSNVAILYLQKVMETLTQSNIEVLAKKHVFEPCGMTHSRFGVGRVLLGNKEPLLAEMKPTDIVMLQKDAKLTAYWIDNGKMVNRTLKETDVPDLVKMLPKEGFASENSDLIKEVASKYGCSYLQPKAINSLLTTPTDYANFVKFLMKDNSVENPFVPHVYMTEDKGMAGVVGVAKGKIPDEDLIHVAWGLGWGLQVDKKDGVTTAYHSGDMNDCRAWVAINVKDKTAMVYFANSHNGHILAEQIIPSTIDLKHAASYFSQKWGFARTFEELGGKMNNWGVNPSLEPKPTEEKKDTEKLDEVEKELSGSKEEEQKEIKSSITPFNMTPQ